MSVAPHAADYAAVDHAPGAVGLVLVGGVGDVGVDADRPSVTVLADPDDAPSCLAELQAGHALERGVVVCLPHPGTATRPQLGASLLIALGKSPAAPTVHRPGGRAWELAERWLSAERVTDLAVLRADRLPAARWADLATVAATAATRLWLVTSGKGATREQLDAVAAARGGCAPLIRPWRAGLAALSSADTATVRGPDDHVRFPAVPDVEFPLFRATAHRLLGAVAFTHLDAVYCETFALAQTYAEDLRLSLLSRTSRADLIDAVLQQLTIDATSPAEVLTRVRAAQAGLFTEGLFVDLRPRVSPTRDGGGVRVEPRLDPSTVARLRELDDPATVAAVVLARAAGLAASTLSRLPLGALTDDGRGALQVRVSSMLGYRIPASAAGLVRAVLPYPRFPSPGHPDGTDASAPTVPGWLFAGPDGAAPEERALTRLRDQGAARAGVTLPTTSFRTGSVTDLRGLPGVQR